MLHKVCIVCCCVHLMLQCSCSIIATHHHIIAHGTIRHTLQCMPHAECWLHTACCVLTHDICHHVELHDDQDSSNGGCSGNGLQWFNLYYMLFYLIMLPPSTAPPSDCTPPLWWIPNNVGGDGHRLRSPATEEELLEARSPFLKENQKW